MHAAAIQSPSRIRGWLRVGIVLSLAWLLAVGVYSSFDFWRIHSAEAGWENVPSAPGNPFDQFDEPSPKSLLVACGPHRPNLAVACSLRTTNLLLLALVPILVAWVIAALTYASVHWIREGFRGDA
jgi:hypothetical protein